MAKISAIEIGRSISIEYGHKILNLVPTNLYGLMISFIQQKVMLFHL